MDSAASTYRNTDVDQYISSDQAISNVRSLAVLWLLGIGNSSIDQKRLAEAESDQSSSGRYNRHDRPLQTLHCYSEEGR